MPPGAIREAGSQVRGGSPGRAGWAGSRELVKHDSPCFPGGAGTWGPCSVITQPGSPLLGLSIHRKAGLELLNSALQSGNDGGEEGKWIQTGVPSLSPKNGGVPLPLALGLSPAALASGVWKFDLFTA